ncbi:MAG: type II toxin-antitoxin system RelE/ParE family toxin [Synechococcaceae cyanobacterium SM2_3_1]|nr:type II toxin-antitoxin system RelE/ParE family toxin [Synechococcaceae cyanobacterium SM2_3_1]
MAFQVEITPIAEAQIEQAYRWYRDRDSDFADGWFRGFMNTVATLQEMPQRCALAVEHEVFSEEVRQLIYRKGKSTYRVLFTIRGERVYVLYVRHSAQAPMTLDDIQDQ